MSIKDKIVNAERWEESQKEAFEFFYGEETYKSWLQKIAFSSLLSWAIPLLTFWIHPLLSYLFILPICTTCFYVHELMHISVAKILDYEIDWHSTTLITILGYNISTQGFDVTFPDKESMQKHSSIIGYFPYTFMIPLSLLMIIFGYSTTNYIFLISGILILGFHLITIWTECSTEPIPEDVDN